MSTDIDGSPMLILGVEEVHKVMRALIQDDAISPFDPLFDKVLKFLREVNIAGGPALNSGS